MSVESVMILSREFGVSRQDAMAYLADAGGDMQKAEETARSEFIKEYESITRIRAK